MSRARMCAICGGSAKYEIEHIENADEPLRHTYLCSQHSADAWKTGRPLESRYWSQTVIPIPLPPVPFGHA